MQGVIDTEKGRPPFVPLVVGVSGHREIENPTDLALRVRTVFLDLLKTRGRQRLIVLTGMAEGADQIVAQVAFDLKEHVAYRHVIDVVACLPLELDEYELDFDDDARPLGLSADAKRAELRRLCAESAYTFVLGGPGASPPSERPRCYRDVGRFIARQSHILLALWDGESKRGEGGTAEVVSAMFGRPPVDLHSRLADPIAAGRVIHILTPRPVAKSPHQIHPKPAASDPVPVQDLWTFPPEAGEPDWDWQRRHDGAKALWETIDASITAFNERVAMDAAPGTNAVDQSISDLKHGTDGPAWDGLDLLTEGYAYADTFALKDKPRWLREHRVLTIGIVVFLSSFVFFTDLLHLPVLMCLYGGGVVAAMIYWSVARSHKNEHLDTRALAEGMRVQLVWRLGGVETQVSDEYLGLQAGELDWIRAAIRGWNLEAAWRCPPVHAARDGVLPNRDIVKRMWIDVQAGFYAKNVSRKARTAARFARARAVFLSLAIASTAGLLLTTLLQGPERHDQPDSWSWLLDSVDVTTSAWWQAAASLSLIAWAVLMKYTDVCAFEEEARQYARMATLFRDAEARLVILDRPSSEASGQERSDAYVALLEDAGREALQENRDWLLLHRDRQISPYA